jgi:hypothetical protein
MNQWLKSQSAETKPELALRVDARSDLDDDAERVILRPAWPRVFPPL